MQNLLWHDPENFHSQTNSFVSRRRRRFFQKISPPSIRAISYHILRWWCKGRLAWTGCKMSPYESITFRVKFVLQQSKLGADLCRAAVVGWELHVRCSSQRMTAFDEYDISCLFECFIMKTFDSLFPLYANKKKMFLYFSSLMIEYYKMKKENQIVSSYVTHPADISLISFAAKPCLDIIWHYQLQDKYLIHFWSVISLFGKLLTLSKSIKQYARNRYKNPSFPYYNNKQLKLNPLSLHYQVSGISYLALAARSPTIGRFVPRLSSPLSSFTWREGNGKEDGKWMGKRKRGKIRKKNPVPPTRRRAS